VGFRFRRSLRIVPGIRLNLSKSGPSLSLGAKGFHYNIGPKGTRVTVGLPGTGLSWSQHSSYSSRTPARPPVSGGAPNVPVVHVQPHPVLTPITSDTADKINTFSTSDLAPILDKAHRRLRFAPFVLILCLCTFFGAVYLDNEIFVGLTALYMTIVVPISIYLDRYRRSVKIKYKPEGIAEKVSAAIAESFSDLTNCAAIWRVSAQGKTWDWKRNAGATTLTRRNKTSLRYTRPNCIRGKVRFPTIKLGGEDLFFLPDGILMADSRSIAALDYKDFTLSVGKTRFIESEGVPRDATVIDETWQYVSKNGGPDRRFKFNRRLPVCLYGEMQIQSAGGLNGLIHLSNATAGDRFGKIVNILSGSTLLESDRKPISAIVKAKSWPSILFGGFLFLYTGIALIVAQQSAAPPSDSTKVPATAVQVLEHIREQPASIKQGPGQQPQSKKAIGKPLVITPQ